MQNSHDLYVALLIQVTVFMNWYFCFVDERINIFIIKEPRLIQQKWDQHKELDGYEYNNYCETK